MRKWTRKGDIGELNLSGSERATPIHLTQEVLREIAHLDDLFEPGEIHPKEYRSKRKRMMEKTKEITMQLRGWAS